MFNSFKKIAHLSSVHSRYDTRIFFKMCQSLTKYNYDIFFIVADGKGDEVKDKVSIKDVGVAKLGRLGRMTNTVKRVFEKGKELDCDLYHLHDPELIPIGLKLKKLGKKVIFDVHENIALQIINKDFIPKIFRSLVSKIYRKYEISSLKKFDALILAENSYLDYYSHLNKKVEVILNMPDLTLLKNFKNFTRKKNEIFYIGSISNKRGFDVTIDALKILKKNFPEIVVHFVGPHQNNSINSKNLKEIDKNLKFYGTLPLNKGLEYSKNAKVGLSILKPIPNYITSYSTKIFEYMAIGLPVVTSNFKLYKEIVEKYDCGFCVDPFDSHELAKIIELIFSNPLKVKQMGMNGAKIVEEKFNWEIERKKLIEFYKCL